VSQPNLVQALYHGTHALQSWYDTFTMIHLHDPKALIKIVSQKLCHTREAEEFSHMIIGPIVIDNKRLTLILNL
jgi:hypothetical protein